MSCHVRRQDLEETSQGLVANGRGVETKELIRLL